MRLKAAPQQFWQSWDEVPEEVPQDMLHLKFLVEIFAGKARLTRAVRRRGKFAVLPPIEVDQSEEVPNPADLLRPDVRRKLEAWLRAGVVQWVHFGTPCTSFSIARKDDGGPPPVRDAEQLYGVPELTDGDRRLLEMGTLLMQVTVQLALLCRQCGSQWSIENPASSLIWIMPEMLALQRHCKPDEVMFHMCAYGAQSKKPTLIWASDRSLGSLRRTRPGNHRHVHLTGKVWSPEHNKLMWRTKLAQVYPDSLCLEWADLLSNSVAEQVEVAPPDLPPANLAEEPMSVDEAL